MIEPGVYRDVSAADYHADGALGHSGAVTLVDDCPARLKWEREHPASPKREFDIGAAVHFRVLQPELFNANACLVPFDNYRTKAAQELRQEAYMLDQVPLLVHEAQAVVEMADAITAHPIAGPLLTGGIAEQSLFWRDQETGVMCKCRPDYRYRAIESPEGSSGEVVINLKTAASAHPDAVRKVAWDHHWWSSEAYTTDGLAAHGIAVSDYLYVVVEKVPPHFIAVCRLPERMVEMGRIYNRKAVHLFAHCTKTDTWPDYGGRIIDLEPPAWSESRFEEARVRGDYSLDEIVP